MNDSTYGVTSSTGITVNDVSGLTQNDLKEGMVAVVNFSGANATFIIADNELKGTVDSVNAANNTITVMGMQVIVDNDTVFEPLGINLNNFAAGNFAEVHGFFDFSNNTIRATRIEKLNAAPVPGEFEVKGTITAGSFDNPPGTFMIGTLTVNYQVNSVVLPAGTGDGSFVEVKGDLNAGTLEAFSVEIEDEAPNANPNDLFEIEGIVTSVTPAQNPTQIVINGIPILISGAAFVNGDIEDLIVGVKAEAEGAVNANGQFVANKIKLKDSVRIAALIDSGSQNPGNNSFTMFNSTITVQITNITALDDKVGGSIATVADINNGDYLRIRGFPGSGNSVVALELERDNNADRSILQGSVQTFNSPDLTILGVTVMTNAQTAFEINDVNIGLDSATFFSTVKQGDVVKAREDNPPVPLGNTINAKEVSLEGIN
jgi:hypothetical protein